MDFSSESYDEDNDDDNKDDDGDGDGDGVNGDDDDDGHLSVWHLGLSCRQNWDSTGSSGGSPD